ncbi:hypothetical protein P378_14690 [Desulforamulus profundi]|uniref:Uncharacterized protein n=1 Tax=Desulforamulus profundi TaxID=1383067 RepID=A0A2C6MC51_9FIRM|nr:hypothetical protein P378_14690 [Desulforamulus profundi]
MLLIKVGGIMISRHPQIQVQQRAQFLRKTFFEISESTSEGAWLSVSVFCAFPATCFLIKRYI